MTDPLSRADGAWQLRSLLRKASFSVRIMDGPTARLAHAAPVAEQAQPSLNASGEIAFSHTAPVPARNLPRVWNDQLGQDGKKTLDNSTPEGVSCN